MKAQKLNRIFLAGLFIFFGIAVTAQPNWSVNPNIYVYSMTLTGEVTSDGYLSMDENDIVAAFIDGECRGIAKVKYVSAVDAYFIFLMVYSNDPIGTVSFKIYDSGSDTEFTIKQNIEFAINGISGSVNQPFLFSANTLNNESTMLAFTVPDQVGETVFSGIDVVLQEHWSGDLTGLVASFTVSEGAKVYVNGAEQESGVTQNDFSSPVEYTVQSADRVTTTVYRVQITFSAGDAKLVAFYTPNQVGRTFVMGNDFYLTEHWSGDLTHISPSFTLSPGATVYVNGVEQVSGISVQDFSEPVAYQVESAHASRVTIYQVEIKYLIGRAKILSFSIPNQDGATDITGTDISLQEHWSGDLTAIIPEFILSDGAKAYVNGVEQVSGVTINNFSRPVEYRVESARGRVIITFTVEIGYSPGEADIIEFSILNQEGTTQIDDTLITLQEHWGGDLTHIAPTFVVSPGATVYVNGVEQTSGVTVKDFSAPVEYIVESAHSSVVKSYRVEIVYSPSEANLLAFSIPDQQSETVITGNNVYLQEHWSLNLTDIAADFTLSDGATAYINGVEQESGVTLNSFVKPVELTVKSAHNSVIKTYSVQVLFADSETKILAFSIPNQEGTTQINDTIITLQEYWTGDLTNIAATFTLPNGSKAYIDGVEQVSGITVNDFSEPVEYTIESAQQSIITNYRVEIVYSPSGANLLTFTIPDQQSETLIVSSHIYLREHWSLNLTDIAADFTLSDGATAYINGVEQESGVTLNSFVNPVEYIIRSAHNSTIKIYRVQVLFDDSEAKMLSFSIPNQEGTTQINDSIVTLQEHWSGNLTNIAANFVLPIGSKVYVDGVEQISDVTLNDFSEPVEYIVESANKTKLKKYIVQITTFNDIPTDIFISSNKKDENDNSTFIGIFSVETDNPAEEHIFSLVDTIGTENHYFIVEGNILRLQNPFNYEEKQSYTINVRADDQKGGVVEKLFEIAVVDVNDIPSEVSITITNTSVNIQSNQVIGEFSAIDEDIGDTHKFALITGDGTTDGDNDKFYIVGNQLKNSVALPFWAGIEYRIYIQAEDNGGATVSRPIVLSTANLRNPPNKLTLSNTIVTANDTLPLMVGILGAEDIDQQEGHIFSLSENLEFGTDNDNFIVVNNELYLTSKPTKEKGDYHIFLAVSDSMGNEFTHEFIITVNKELNEDQFFLSNADLSENMPINSIVGFFDSDLFKSSEYNLSLPLEVDLDIYNNNAFNFNERTLLSNRFFDYEEKSDWLIQINISDGSTQITKNVVIHIIDENDSPTSITTSTQVVSEATKVNSVVAELGVEDQDLGDSHTYNLAIGNGINDEGNTMFKIIGNNLVLVRPLDFESKEYQSILLRVTDSDGAIFEQGIRLQVIDANDPPEFLSKSASYVLQDQVFVYAIVASDSENDDITYNFLGLPSWLTYNSGSNIISGVAGNDLVGVYNFSIQANDGKSIATQQVVLSVINVNDPPEINYYLGLQHFITNFDNVVELPTNCIVDPDVGDELTYNLSMNNKSAMPDWIHFDPATLIVSGNPPKEEYGIYKLKLTATDKGKLKEWLVFDLEVTIPTVLGDKPSGQFFQVYPNPVDNKLYVHIPQNNNVAHVSIVNITGKVIKSFVFDSGNLHSIHCGDIVPGVYFVKLKQGENQLIKKIIKN